MGAGGRHPTDSYLQRPPQVKSATLLRVYPQTPPKTLSIQQYQEHSLEHFYLNYAKL